MENCLFPFEQDSDLSFFQNFAELHFRTAHVVTFKSEVLNSPALKVALWHSGMLFRVCRDWSGVHRDGDSGALTKSTLSYGSEEARYFHLDSKLFEPQLT